MSHMKPEYARSKYHTQLANMSFDPVLDLTAVFFFEVINMYVAVDPYTHADFL